MKLWLDDVRPAPPGWVHVRTLDEAKTALASGDVVRASLDHDLGWCDKCAEDTVVYGYATVSGSCQPVGTGYDLVFWMEETGTWPPVTTVHSANPVGAKRMRQVIEKHYA